MCKAADFDRFTQYAHELEEKFAGINPQDFADDYTPPPPDNDEGPTQGANGDGAAEGVDRSSEVDLCWQDVPRTFTKANSSMTDGWKFEASWRQLINADFQHHKISRPEDAVWGDPGDMEMNAPDKLRKRAKNKHAIILAPLDSYEPGAKLYPPKKDPKKKPNNRHKANMLPACGFAVDCDGAPPYEENVRGIDAEGVACIGASSFNHSPPMVHKYRFFIPVREPIPVELHTAVFEKIVKRLKIEGVDPACMRAQQCSFLPTHDGVSETFIDLSRFDRPLLSVEKEIEEARAEAAAEAKKSPRDRARDARRKEAGKRAEWCRLVKTGENLHDPLLRLSSSYMNDGLSEEEIVDRLRKVMEDSDARVSRPGDWQNRHDSIPRLVSGAYDKWGEDEHIVERREALAWMNDAGLRDQIEDEIAKLTKDSIARGLDSLDTLFLMVGCLRTKGPLQRDFAERIAKNIQRRRVSDITDLIADASERAWDIWNAAYGAPEDDKTDDDLRPIIDLATTDDEEVCRQVRDAIQARCDASLENGNDPMLYEGPAGVSRVAEKRGQPVTAALTVPMWPKEINKVLRFRDGCEPKTRFIPPNLVQVIHATPEMSLPRLNGYDDTPVFGPDFELMDKPGYNKTTGRIYRPAPGFEGLDIPKKPTPDQVRASVDRLVDVFEGFPFRDDESPEKVAEIEERVARGELTPSAGRALLGHSSRAHALAMVIEPFVRGAFAGETRTPLYNMRKNNQRVGSMMLANTVSRIAFGADISVESAPATEDEWRKRAISKVKAQSKTWLTDNFTGCLDSPVYAAVLTSTIYSDRELATNNIITGSADFLHIINGNNFSLAPDFIDRSVLVRLYSADPRPGERTDFVRPGSAHWAYLSAVRSQLVSDVLTLIQNYFVKGANPFTGTAMGGFSEWVGHVGGILHDADIPGFMENRHLLRGGAIDPEAAQLRSFLTAWWSEFGEAAVRVGDPAQPLSGILKSDAGLLSLIKTRHLEIGKLDVDQRSVNSARMVLRNMLVGWTDKPVVIGGGDSGVPEITVWITARPDTHKEVGLWALRRQK